MIHRAGEFLRDTPTREIYTLSLLGALPLSDAVRVMPTDRFVYLPITIKEN